jgi:hypothetical protein
MFSKTIPSSHLFASRPSAHTTTSSPFLVTAEIDAHFLVKSLPVLFRLSRDIIFPEKSYLARFLLFVIAVS